MRYFFSNSGHWLRRYGQRNVGVFLSHTDKSREINKYCYYYNPNTNPILRFCHNALTPLLSPYPEPCFARLTHNQLITTNILIVAQFLHFHCPRASAISSTCAIAKCQHPAYKMKVGREGKHIRHRLPQDLVQPTDFLQYFIQIYNLMEHNWVFTCIIPVPRPTITINSHTSHLQ